MPVGSPYFTKTHIVDAGGSTQEAKRNPGGSGCIDESTGDSFLLQDMEADQTMPGDSPRGNLGASPMDCGGTGENGPETPPKPDVPMSNVLKLLRRNSNLQVRIDKWKDVGDKPIHKHLIPQPLIHRIRQMFEQLDSDYDGFLSTDELRSCYRHPLYGGSSANRKTVDDILSDCIRQSRLNGDDLLDYEEFLDFMLVPQETFATRHWNKIIFISVGVWFCLAPAVYCNFNRRIRIWSFWDALYFSAATVTTVGYGDFMPDSDEMKLFTVAYIFSGLIIVSRVISEFADYLVNSYDRRMRSMDAELSNAFVNNDAKRERRKLRSQSVMHSSSVLEFLAPPPRTRSTSMKDSAKLWFTHLREMLNVIWMYIKTALTDVFGHWFQEHKMVIHGVTTTLALVLLPISIGTAFAYHNEGWTFVDSFYWTCVTVTSVGYGDLTLKQPSSRIFAFFFILFGFACLGAAIARAARLKMELRLYHKKQKLLNRSLSVNLLMEMDKDGNGVDRCEFLCAMLLQMDKVTNDDLRPLLQRFDQLDADNSGVLTRVDIEIMRKESRDRIAAEQSPECTRRGVV